MPAMALSRRDKGGPKTALTMLRAAFAA